MHVVGIVYIGIHCTYIEQNAIATAGKRANAANEKARRNTSENVNHHAVRWKIHIAPGCRHAYGLVNCSTRLEPSCRHSRLPPILTFFCFVVALVSAACDIHVIVLNITQRAPKPIRPWSMAWDNCNRLNRMQSIIGIDKEGQWIDTNSCTVDSCLPIVNLQDRTWSKGTRLWK